VAREALLLVAGLVWTGVGVMLCVWAYVWLAAEPLSTAVALAAAGLVGALAAWRLMFAPIARSNIERIEQAPIRACLFSFQAWRGYVIMVAMIALGALLRHSAIPRTWLAPVYAAIGGGLLLASVGYHARFLQLTSGAQ
jgi:hypothetical protein